MASPLPSGKQSVNLAAGGVRVSRIRRNPPPVVREKPAVDPEERDQWVVILGVITFALAIAVVVLAFSSYSDWSPSEHTVRIEL